MGVLGGLKVDISPPSILPSLLFHGSKSLVPRAPSKFIYCEQVGSSGTKAGGQRPLVVYIGRPRSVREEARGLTWLVSNGVWQSGTTRG